MSVTGTRYFSRKLSQSRNNNKGERNSINPSPLPDHCHYCEEPFRPGQMRYPIFTGISYGWGLASVCMDCFKAVDDEFAAINIEERDGHTDQITRLNRAVCECKGCGEPILTAINAPSITWETCSRRCYQRVYRKRRRGRGSVVDWKEEARFPCCESCEREFEPMRRDARFCCNACRQRRYRMRQQRRDAAAKRHRTRKA